jgi:hypothetical protein
MTTSEWILDLKKKEILTEGMKNLHNYLHLKTPCKIHINARVIQELRFNYETDQEKGGLLSLIPSKVGDEVHLEIDRIIFLKNISGHPENSYLPENIELDTALKSVLDEPVKKALPIRFHTHPSYSQNPINEIFNYLIQSNTSEKDQIVSDLPIRIGDLDLLMPRCLILSGDKIVTKMFIGFYNGLIAPVEFDNHRKEVIQKARNTILDNVSAWTEEGNNKWFLYGGSILLIIGIIRYNKFAVPLILLLFSMIPFFINSEIENPKYFSQVSTGDVTINLP